MRIEDRAGATATNLYMLSVVRTFGDNHDQIAMLATDADLNGAGDQAISFVGSWAFSGVACQLRDSGGLLQADVNGDRVTDLEIFLASATHLDRSDFML